MRIPGAAETPGEKFFPSGEDCPHTSAETKMYLDLRVTEYNQQSDLMGERGSDY